MATYREATQEEIQKAGSIANDLEDWEAARAYALHLFGPTVARVKLNVDHTFDDGEEHRYISQGPYKNEKHQGWDADGNELDQLFDPENPDWEKDEDAPEFNNIDPWHMEFDFTQEPRVVVLYVRED